MLSYCCDARARVGLVRGMFGVISPTNTEHWSGRTSLYVVRCTVKSQGAYRQASSPQGSGFSVVTEGTKCLHFRRVML